MFRSERCTVLVLDDYSALETKGLIKVFFFFCFTKKKLFYWIGNTNTLFTMSKNTPLTISFKVINAIALIWLTNSVLLCYINFMDGDFV